MKIGIFDSGLGGLIILRGIRKLLPKYDYLYLGDTKRMPYGNRSQNSVYNFTKQGVDYLLKHDCGLVIVACNTASAKALRKIQQNYLPQNFPDRRVLGVIIPTVEEVVAKNYKRVGVLATLGTVKSKTFEREFKKLSPKTRVFSYPAPALAQMIEDGTFQKSEKEIHKYVQPFLKHKIQCLVLGCTHYPLAMSQIQKFLPKPVNIISQEKIIPKKLKNYLTKHRQIESKLTKESRVDVLLTKMTDRSKKLSKEWLGSTKLKLVAIE